jgi:tetratricopeptide (TPR) repeat protein
MGVVKRLEGDFDSAFDLLSGAKAECEIENDQLSVGHCLREMGTTERNRGRFAEGLLLLTQAEKLYGEHQFKLGSAHASREIGTCQVGLHQHDQALVSYHKALGEYREMGAPLGEANTFVCLGQYYGSVGDNVMSTQMYDQARVIFARIGDQVSIEKIGSPTPLVGLKSIQQ